MRLTSHPLYKTWDNMNQRCKNPNSASYARYGGNGIKVCEEWSGVGGFAQFLKDMGEKPVSGERYTIERIDNSKGYEPSNCRWATYSEQALNRRVVIRINKRERSGIMGYRPGKAIWGIYAPQEIADRVNKYREEHKRTLTYVVLEAVDQFLKSKGY